MHDVLSLTSAAPLPDHEIEIEIAAIDVVDRLRLVDRDKVEMIAASVSECGYLHQAIAVAAIADSNRVELVDGEHRLEAFKRLGRVTIPARIREMTVIERRRHEIHANLIRNELNKLQRARFIGQLAELFAGENANARNGGDRKSKKWLAQNQLLNLSNWSAFNKEAARRTGLSEGSIRRDRELAAALSPDVVALIDGTKLADNQSQLRALADLPVDQQLAVAKAVAAKPKLSFGAAREAAGLVPEGGAVREPDRFLTKIEPMLPRMSALDLETLIDMAKAELAGRRKPAKPSRSQKGDAL
jgi:ParB family chromosome partitioning protein